MLSPEFHIEAPKESNIAGELSDFSLKSTIVPPIRSSYLALGIAYFQSLFRLKDEEFCNPAWAALDELRVQTGKLRRSWPDTEVLWSRFEFLIAWMLNAKRDELFNKWQKFISKNAQGACDAIDLVMRLLMCKIIDKDYKYGDILTQPFNVQNDAQYLELFCNKLGVNILIVSQSSHNYIVRSDKNKSPLVAIYKENDVTLSVLYHREYLQYEEGYLTDNNLDRFPFVYDPRAARSSIPSPGLFPTNLPVSSGPPFLKKFPNAEESQREANPSGVRFLKKVTTTEENKQEVDPAGTRSLSNAPIIEENKVNSPATNEVCKRLISNMASIIFLNNFENFNDEFIKDLNDYTEMDPSANIGDVLRLKNFISQLRPPKLPAPQVSNCGHPPLKYTSFCGNEHCAYCLKEIMDRDLLRAKCDHGVKIPPKNANEIRKLIESGKNDAAVTNPNQEKARNVQDFRAPSQIDEIPNLGPMQGPPPNIGLTQGPFKPLPMNQQFKAAPMQKPSQPMQEPANDSQIQEPPKASPMPEPKKKPFYMPTAKPEQSIGKGNFPEGTQMPGRPGAIQNVGQSQQMGGNNQPINPVQPPFKAENIQFPPQQGNIVGRPASMNMPSQPQQPQPSQFQQYTPGPMNMPPQPQQPGFQQPPQFQQYTPASISMPSQQLQSGFQPQHSQQFIPQKLNNTANLAPSPQPINLPSPFLPQNAQPYRNEGIPSGPPGPMFPAQPSRNEGIPSGPPGPMFPAQPFSSQPRYEENQPYNQKFTQATPNPPAPPNNWECAVCQQIKDSSDFSFACPDHNVCNLCRVKNVNECVSCGRIYSNSQKSELDVVLFSLS